MKGVLIGLFLVGIIIVISGCAQAPVQKENFTQEHFSYTILDYAVGLDTDIWPTKEAWAIDICQMCQIGMINHSILGIQKCAGYPDETCNCPISLRATFDLTLPDGWDEASCDFIWNDKLLETILFNETGSQDYVVDSSLGPRIDENSTVEICCEDICDTNTLISVC